MNFVKYNCVTKNGKGLILEDNRVVVLIINDCIGVWREAAGVIDSCWHARSSSAICRSSAATRRFDSANAGSVLPGFSLSSALSARFVGQQTDPRRFGERRKKRDKRRQNPSKALKVNAEEGVNKAPDSDIKQVMPDSREG